MIVSIFKIHYSFPDFKKKAKKQVNKMKMEKK